MRRHGHARVDPRSPRAFATCDRCSRLFNHDDLHWQTDWRGRNLQNLRLLVCDSCLDVPQEQLRVIVLPPDPLPILNARPELADMGATTVVRGLQLAGESGSYGLTGSSATLRVTYKVALASGAYGLTGDASALDLFPPSSAGSAFSSGFSSGFGIGVSTFPSGSYGLTGRSATLRLTRPLSLASGAYGLTGHTGTLTLTLGGVGTIAEATGTFALSGHALGTLTTRKLPEATGSFALTGSTATLIRRYTLSAASGAYAMTGSATVLKTTLMLPATTGAFALSGSTTALSIPVTWNPADKYASINLSNGNLTASLSSNLSGGVTDVMARATRTRATGYFELTFGTFISGQPHNSGVGVANLSASLSVYPGNANSIGYFGDGYHEGPSGFSSGSTFGAGDVLGVEITASTAKFTKNGTLIFTESSLPAGALYPVISLAQNTDSGTANFGATAMSFLPVGVTSWDGKRTG